MPSIDLLIVFFATTAVYAFIPGPAMLYAAARTLAGSRRAGVMASLGIHLGCYVHVGAAAAGLSMLFHAVPSLYLAVKLAGGVYLVWLGIGLLQTRNESASDLPEFAAQSARRAFIQSVSIEVVNPKTAIFFMAFLPQFIDASATLPVWSQFVILGTVVNLMFSAADLVCVFLSSRIVGRFRRSSRARLLAQRAGGTILVGLGLHVALQRS